MLELSLHCFWSLHKGLWDFPLSCRRKCSAGVPRPRFLSAASLSAARDTAPGRGLWAVSVTLRWWEEYMPMSVCFYMGRLVLVLILNTISINCCSPRANTLASNACFLSVGFWQLPTLLVCSVMKWVALGNASVSLSDQFSSSHESGLRAIRHRSSQGGLRPKHPFLRMFIGV